MRRRGGCDCAPCMEAARLYERHRSKLRILGRPAYIDPAATRRHVQALLAAGMTVNEVEQHSGVHRTGIRVMLGTYPGRPASKGIRPATAAKLLAVRPSIGTPTPTLSGTVDGTGTRRRLQASLANGWPATTLAVELGTGPRLQIARAARVRAATAAAVRDLYDRIGDKPGPSPKTATYWRGRGYLPPAWWDDDTIDDPTAEPDGLREYDGRGRLLVDHSAWRVDRVLWLADQGHDPAAIADALGITTKLVRRDLARGHREDGAA